MLRKARFILCLLMVLCLATGMVWAQDFSKSSAGTKMNENVDNRICPVTGKMIDQPGQYTVEYHRKVYNLCSPTCKKEFLKSPKKYVEKVNKDLQAFNQDVQRTTDEMIQQEVDRKKETEDKILTLKNKLSMPQTPSQGNVSTAQGNVTE